MLGDKELPRHLHPNPRPVRRRDRGIDRLPDRRIERSDPLSHLDVERRRIVHDLERCPQPHDILEVLPSEVGAVQLLQPCLGQRMQPAPEQSPHLLRRHRIAHVQTVDTRHAGPDPHPGRLAPLGVIRGEPDVSLVGRVQGSDLPGQIVITGSCSELVQAHRHTHPKGYMPPGRSSRPELLPTVHGVYRVCDLSRSLHWLMRIGGRPVTSTHTGAGEPVAGVWRGGLGCHWIVATSTRVCVLAEVPPDRRR
jgi:hypothetical protein